MTRATCPDIGNWQSLLDDGAGADESAELVSHLETCADCRHTLESLAADPVAWEDAACGLEKQARKEPALRDVVARFRNEDAPAAEDDLSFLRPADKPGLLGMLGPYEVEAEIGRGGMGIVLKARDPALDRVVALKVFSPHLAASSTARRRFIRERRAAAAVCHDHIVTVYHVNEAGGLPYLVMQYVAGESLQDRLDRAGPLEIEELVSIGAQTAFGLAAAHARGLIHRDIKPANLLLEDSRVKITDFGLARMTDDVQLTQNGVLAGTPEYMAPEQSRGETVDHRADLFSLGSVLYALGTGVSPFRGPTTLALIRQVCEETPTPMRALNPDVPDWLETLVARLMAKAPAERFQSAAEVAPLLEGYLAHLQQPATAPVPELAPHSSSGGRGRSSSGFAAWIVKRFRPWFAFAAFVLLAALGLFYFLLFQNDPLEQRPPNQLEQDFRGSRKPMEPWRLFGPAPELVSKPEKEGWRITLPADRPDLGPVGLVAETPVRGNFTLTTSYEILQVDRPTTGDGVGFELYVMLDTPARDAFGFYGLARVEVGEGFLCVRTADKDGRRKSNNKFFPGLSKAGQLRVTRQGADFTFWVKEDGAADFRELVRYDLGPADLKSIRLAAYTGNAKHAVDLRIRDLKVSADAIQPPAPPLPPDIAPQQGGRRWLLAAGLLAIGLIFAVAALALVGLFMRQRRTLGNSAPQASGTASLSIACGGCGKKLKIKSDLAGKKVKCPECGKPVPVPRAEPTPAKKGGSLAMKLWLVGLLGLGCVGLAFVLLGAWFFWSAPPARGPLGAAPSFLEIPLGGRVVAGVEEAGFYQEESNDSGPFRWTDGKARLVIPLDKNDLPQALFVNLQRPKGTSLRIAVNDRELFNEKATDQWHNIWEKTLDLNGVNLGEKITVEIASNAIEMENDARKLGAKVRVVKLLRRGNATPIAPLPPSFLDFPLGNRAVAGVEDSGFHKDGQDKSGPFRWTNGQAKLVIPLEPNERPKALWVLLHRPNDRWVRITLNQRELVNEKTTDTEVFWWERTFDLSGIEFGAPAVLEIASNASATPNDGRQRGVKVREIKLLREKDPENVSFVDVPLGGRFVRGVKESGFLDQGTHDGQPSRWTDGSARMTIPLGGKKPRTLALTAFIPSPPGCWVKVTVNGKKLFDGKVKSSSIWSCELPLTGMDLGDSAHIEVDSPTFVPAQVDPKSKDTRVLGINLKRLVLLSDSAVEKK